MDMLWRCFFAAVQAGVSVWNWSSVPQSFFSQFVADVEFVHPKRNKQNVCPLVGHQTFVGCDLSNILQTKSTVCTTHLFIVGGFEP